MIARFKALNPEQRKLALSLIANFATRVPGLIGVLLFLPRLKREIGLESFATLMASIALGGSATFAMNGLANVARRLFGDAFSREDRVGEADAARAVRDVATVGTVLSALVIVAYAAVRGSTPGFYIGALVTALAVLLQQQDAVRAAYNEHYVTATVLVIVQSIAYAVALLLLPSSAYGMLLGIAVIVGPIIAASLVSLIDLLHRRPYLRDGRPYMRGSVLRQSVLLGVGEGLLMASLGFVTLYLDFMGAIADSAWYATTLRLFMVVLVPVVLILLPLSSYIRLVWNRCTPARQRGIVSGTLAISLAYSLVVGAELLVLSRLYVGGVMNIPEPGSHLETGAVFAMFAAVVVFKSYTSVSFVVLDSRWLSWAAAAGTIAAITAGALAATWLPPIGAVAVFAAALTLAIVMVTTADALRFRRTLGL